MSLYHLLEICDHVKAIQLVATCSSISCTVAMEAEIVASLCAARHYFTLFLTEEPSAKIDLNVSTTLRAGVWKTFR